MEPYLKAVAQKMLDNHINSHPKSELKAIFTELITALLRPKSRNTKLWKYNRRIEKVKQRIVTVLKLLGIMDPNTDVVRFEFNPTGFNPNAVNMNVVNPFIH